MNREALDLWDRAVEALSAALTVLEVSPDAAASRAYYAAFYAVSAAFAAEGITFKRHSAVEAAVHRKLVKPGKWETGLGASYTKLFELRQTSDYGGGKHVTGEDARGGIDAARVVLEAVSLTQQEHFHLPGDGE